MLEAISLDAKTILIKSDKEGDLLEVMEFISRKDKKDYINAFLDFASQNRIIEKNYKFDRDDCYDR